MTDPLQQFDFPIRSADVWGLNDPERKDAEDIAADLDFQDSAIKDYLNNVIPNVYIQQSDFGTGIIDPAQLASGTPGAGKAPVGNPPAWTDIATQAELDTHVNDTSDAHLASAIGYTPGTGMSATEAQSALDELASEKEDWARTVRTTTTTHILILNDYKSIVVVNASTNTVTIPTNASVAFPVGSRIPVISIGAGQTSVSPDGGVTANGRPGLKLTGQYSRVLLEKIGTDTWIVSGDLSA